MHNVLAKIRLTIILRASRTFCRILFISKVERIRQAVVMIFFCPQESQGSQLSSPTTEESSGMDLDTEALIDAENLNIERLAFRFFRASKKRCCSSAQEFRGVSFLRITFIRDSIQNLLAFYWSITIEVSCKSKTFRNLLAEHTSDKQVT